MSPDREPTAAELAELDQFEAACHQMAGGLADALSRMQIMMTALRKVEQEGNRLMARQIQRHPDLAELDVQLNGFYGDAGGS